MQVQPLYAKRSIDTQSSQKATLLATEIYLLHLVEVTLAFYYQFFRLWQKVNQNIHLLQLLVLEGKAWQTRDCQCSARKELWHFCIRFKTSSRLVYMYLFHRNHNIVNMTGATNGGFKKKVILFRKLAGSFSHLCFTWYFHLLKNSFAEKFTLAYW